MPKRLNPRASALLSFLRSEFDDYNSITPPTELHSMIDSLEKVLALYPKRMKEKREQAIFSAAALKRELSLSENNSV